MSRSQTATVRKQKAVHDEEAAEINRIRLKRSDFYLLDIPKSDRKVGTPHVTPTVSLRLITSAVDWVAKERERLLNETRKANVKKK